MKTDDPRQTTIFSVIREISDARRSPESRDCDQVNTQGRPRDAVTADTSAAHHSFTHRDGVEVENMTDP